MSVTSRRKRVARLAPQKRNGRTLLDTNERQQVMQQVTAAVYSTLDLEEVFKRIIDGAISSLGYTIAFVTVLDDGKNCFEIKALSAQKRLLPQIKKVLGFQLAGLSVPADPVLNATMRSLGKGRVTVVKTLAEIAYPVFSNEVCSALQKLGGSKNYIVVPLQNRGELVGALFVSSPREDVSEKELAVLQNFAWSASQAIRNANLYTQTKQTQEQLQESEENLRTYLENAPDGVYLNDLKGNFLYVNKKAEEILGYKREELIGKGFLKLNILPAKYLAKAGKLLALNAIGRPNGPDEFELTRKDGSPRWVEISTAPIKQGGEIVVIGFVRDITERKEAEELYTTLANSSPVGVYLLQDGKFVFTNPAFQEATGLTDDDLLGRDAPRIVHPEDRQRVRKNAIEMVKGERLQPYEFRYITKIGETKWALERTASITYQGRRASLANFLDVTESKQAQERIERAAEEWRTTFDSITDFISIHDKDSRIVRVNKALADALKTTPKELIGKVCHEVMHGTKEPPANCPQRQTLRTGKSATIEMFEPSLGIWIQESTSPIFDEKGEVTGSVHIVRDVSDQKRMEEQLIMTDRLASIGELASGIAHELNNPLTSVIGFSQLLMEGNVPDNIKEDLGTVYSEAQRAAAIVKNLLTFARKHTPVKQLSQVNAVIEDVLRLRAYEQKVNNIEVDKRLATGLPEIMVDNFQMQQAFLNIIVNAEFAMLEAHGKGKLAITTERVNGVIKVTFTDDGPGISKENMKRLFSPFFTTKEVGKGTGLGLSICHGIVSEHGGRIYAESELGQGATFVVELPLNGH
jgi:PAS domain S-box-containing protein